MFRQRFGQFKTFMSNSGVYNNQKFGISTKTHKNNFDKMLNKWCQAVFPGKSIALSLAGLNLGLWLWCNFTTNKEKRWISFESLSYSENSHKNRDYINLFASGLLSRRIDDLVFDVGVMAVLGKIFSITTKIR